MPDRRSFKLNHTTIARGQTADIRLKVSETYTGDEVAVPIRVIRSSRRGPVVVVTAAVHGNETNGTGIVHELMYGEPLDLVAGTLLLLPVVNIFGFETQTRYMPDRRDLNRSFPGSSKGSLTRRIADVIFRQVISQCDFGVDLHSAAVGRTNFPNVRADLANPAVRRIARAFGTELIVHGKGPMGSLRREACRAGCPTIILEAGEPSKIEPSVLRLGARGVRNVLKELGVLAGTPIRPSYQARVDKSKWIRAQVGGILRFHVTPGSLVEANQPVATNVNVFGQDQNVVTAPADGIVLSMTTLPTVKPGEPICHLAMPRKSLSSIREALKGASRQSLHRMVRNDLATSISVTEPAEQGP